MTIGQFHLQNRQEWGAYMEQSVETKPGQASTHRYNWAFVEVFTFWARSSPDSLMDLRLVSNPQPGLVYLPGWFYWRVAMGCTTDSRRYGWELGGTWTTKEEISPEKGLAKVSHQRHFLEHLMHTGLCARDRYKNKIKPCLQGTELVLGRFLTHTLESMTRDDRKREVTLCWTISLPGILRGNPCIGQEAAIWL